MHVRIKRSFGVRKVVLESREVNKKYFLVFEGEETEKLYFEGIQENREKLEISPLIEIKEIKRSFNEKGWSNPKKILDRLLEFLTESDEEEFMLSSIITGTIDLLLLDEVISSDSIYDVKDIKEVIIKYFKDECHIDDFEVAQDFEKSITTIIKCLNEYLDISNVILALPEYIKSQKIVFDPEIDKVCLIVDRDKDSFVNHEHNPQYDYVVEQCTLNKIDLYLSNPCFEFWLLLHFDEVHVLDIEKLLENPKITTKKRYAEDELSKIVPGFKKNNIKFDLFVNHIDKAITNQKSFKDNLVELETHVGSNIGNLITEMKSKER